MIISFQILLTAFLTSSKLMFKSVLGSGQCDPILKVGIQRKIVTSSRSNPKPRLPTIMLSNA